MNIGDRIPCRCPKCHSTDLALFEEFTVCDAIVVENGAMTYREAGVSPSLTGRVFGECARPHCKHRWKFRKSPVMAAFRAQENSNE